MLDKSDAKIEEMFSRIVDRYDILNTVMSMGMAGLWRRSAVRHAGMSGGKTALDICCGTGDLAFALSNAGGKTGQVAALDFSEAMLRRAMTRGRNGSRVSFTLGNALALPFRSSCFDCVTVAFGLRNVSDVRAAVSEMCRVTSPGGRVVCLEIGRVEKPFARHLWKLWFTVMSPLLATLFGSDQAAYSYLVDSVSGFMRPAELAEIFSDCGLADVGCRKMALGSVFIVYGAKPA